MAKYAPPNVPEGHKWCHQCSTAKPFSAFYRSSTKPDGLNYCCKTCTAATRERGLELQRLTEEAIREVQEWVTRCPRKVPEGTIPPMSI